MTMKITEDCIACGACVPECPTESISEGDGITYVISQATCVECEGHYDSPKCVTVCPCRLHRQSELRNRTPGDIPSRHRSPGHYAICAQKGIISTIK